MNSPNLQLTERTRQPLPGQRGFTLIELITVVVLLAIIATIGTGFVASSLQSYTETQQRAKLINRGRQAIEQITRHLRNAAPNSLRITNSGNCLEFLPLAGGGFYLNPVPDISNGAGGTNSIAVAPYNVSFAAPNYAVIGANSAAEIYDGNSLATLRSTTATDLTLTGNKVWARNSSTQRFFLADNPEAFCISGTDLRHHRNYATPLSSTGIPSGTGDLMGENVSSATPFTIDTGTETRSAVITVDLLFTERSQQVPLRQEVYIRNVP